MPHKKLMNIKVLIIFIVFAALLIILSRTINQEIPLETGIFGTMFTFFYSLFVNSIFKFLDEKYVNVRIYLGELIGRSQSLYNTVLLTGNKKFISVFRRDLTSFLKSFNTLKPQKYYENQGGIDLLYADISLLKVKTPKQSQEYSRMIQFIDGLSLTREKLEIFGKKHLTGETRFILVSTTALYIIFISVTAFSKLNLYVNIIGLLLIIIVLFVIVLMFNLDNLSYGSYYIKTKNIEEIIDDIEKNDAIKNMADVNGGAKAAAIS